MVGAPDFATGMNADMRLLKPSRSKSPQAWPFPVFRGPEDDLSDENRRIGILIDSWLNSRSEPRPHAQAARRAERKLHDAIKAGPLFGKILSFAGLNLWVDDRTSDGLVMMQESINI